LETAIEEVNEFLDSASPLSSTSSSSQTTGDSPSSQPSSQVIDDVAMADFSYATPPPVSACSTLADIQADFCDDFITGSSTLLDQLFDLNYYNS